MPVTRLSDYLLAEERDETEPVSFYVPGAPDWKSARARAREIDVPAEPPLDTTDTQDVDEFAELQQTATQQLLED